MEEATEKKKGSKIGKVLAILLATFLIAIAVIGIVGYVYYRSVGMREEEKMQAIRKQNQTAFLPFEEPIEYGTEMSYEELCEKLIASDHLSKGTTFSVLVNHKELTKGSQYVFETVGNHVLQVRFSCPYEYTFFTKQLKMIENTKDYVLVVEDTKPPILSGIEDKIITIGDEFDPKSGVTAHDEVDGALEVQIEGTVDTAKAGEYVIKVFATDKNENVAEQTYTVTVKEKPVEKAPSTTTNKGSSTISSNANKTTTTTSQEEVADDTSTKSGRLKLANAEEKRVVGQITKPSMSVEQKAQAICSYLYQNVARQTNQSNEAYKANFGNEAYAALILKKAACSGFCKAVTLMCNAAGVQSKHINANSWQHQWNTVLINSEWIILDAQIGLLGGTVHPLEAN